MACGGCGVVKTAEDVVRVGACGHGCCAQCVVNRLDAAVAQGTTAGTEDAHGVSCPVVGCGQPMRLTDLVRVLPADAFDAYAIHTLRRVLAAPATATGSSPGASASTGSLGKKKSRRRAAPSAVLSELRAAFEALVSADTEDQPAASKGPNDDRARPDARRGGSPTDGTRATRNWQPGSLESFVEQGRREARLVTALLRLARALDAAGALCPDLDPAQPGNDDDAVALRRVLSTDGWWAVQSVLVPLLRHSFHAMAERAEIAHATLDVLDVLASRPLLLACTNDDDRIADTDTDTEPDRRLLTAVEELHRQTDVFLSLTQHQLPSGNLDPSDPLTADLVLPLRVQVMAVELGAAHAIFAARYHRPPRRREPAADPGVSSGPGHGGLGSVEAGLHDDDGDNGLGNTEAASPPAPKPVDAVAPEVEQEYVNALQRYRFQTARIHYATHAYHAEIVRDASAQPERGRLQRIHRELTSLGSDLPVAWSSAIFVCADEDRPEIIRAVITGPAGTPYQDGCFVFDLYLPLTYPNEPPLVTFRTTANNQVRFNPNLYQSGKVCLSLLGTWPGDPWIPATSSIFQVLVSIQSQVLNSLPYRNEPTLENGPREHCEEYNRNIRFYTAMVAILDAIPSPSSGGMLAPGRVAVPELAEAIALHLRLKRATILQTVAGWAANDKPLPAKERATVPGLVHDWQEIFDWWTWPLLVSELERRLPNQAAGTAL